MGLNRKERFPSHLRREALLLCKRETALPGGRAVCYNGCVGRKGLRRAPRNAYRSGVMGMSDFEMISIYLMILSLVVLLLKKDK